MDLQPSSEVLNSSDYRWLGSKHAVNTGKSVTVLIPTAGDSATVLYPDGFLKSGTLLAKYTSGANQGLWAPWVQDDVAGEGLATVAGVALDGFRVRQVDGANIATKTAGACLLPDMSVQIVPEFLPELLQADGTTTRAPVAADLAGYAVQDLM